MELLDSPQVYLPDLWATHATFQPDQEAVVCGPVRRSWRDFDANMSRVANALLAMGRPATLSQPMVKQTPA